MIGGERERERDRDSMKSNEVKLLEHSRTHTRTARRDQDAGCIYVHIRERDIKCTKILSNSSRFFITVTMDLITDPRSFSRALSTSGFSYLVLK